MKKDNPFKNEILDFYKKHNQYQYEIEKLLGVPHRIKNSKNIYSWRQTENGYHCVCGKDILGKRTTIKHFQESPICWKKYIESHRSEVTEIDPE